MPNSIPPSSAPTSFRAPSIHSSPSTAPSSLSCNTKASRRKRARRSSTTSMERSRSCSDKSSSSNAPAAAASATGLRCYSACYVTSKNAKGTTTTTTWPSSAASSSPATSAPSSVGSKARMWSGAPSELRRKRRVAGYRVYAVEGSVKGSLKSGVRWLKSKCSRMVDGWW